MIRWMKVTSSGIEAWEAYSGGLCVGHAVHRSAEPRRWVYSLNAVSTKYIAKGHGEVATATAAKRAIARAWAQWLKLAELNSTGAAS